MYIQAVKMGSSVSRIVEVAEVKVAQLPRRLYMMRMKKFDNNHNRLIIL